MNLQDFFDKLNMRVRDGSQDSSFGDWVDSRTFIKTKNREREKHDFEIVGITVDYSGRDVRRKV